MNDELNSENVAWLNQTFVETPSIPSKSDVEEKKPNFVKLYSNNKEAKWYKISESRQDGTDVLLPATKYEIKRWGLK